MTTNPVIQFDNTRTLRDFNEKDVVAGAMFLSVFQWITNGYSITNNIFFTNSQFRAMGSLIRELATSPNSNASLKIKNLYDYLFSQSIIENFNLCAKTVVNNHEKIYFWNLVYQAAQSSVGNRSLLNLVDEVLTANNLWDTYGYIKPIIKEIELSLDKGMDFENDLIVPFKQWCDNNSDFKIKSSTSSWNTDQNLILESNASVLRLESDGLWKLFSSLITNDKSNNQSMTQYNDTRPNLVLYENSIGFAQNIRDQWDGRYYPTFIKSKDIESRYELDFPLITFNNYDFTMRAVIPTDSAFVEDIEDLDNFDTELNGLYPTIPGVIRLVAGIVGLKFGNTSYRHYFHCKDFDTVDSVFSEAIVEIDSYFINTTPVIPATNDLMGSCTFTGSIFSIDPIEIQLTSVEANPRQLLLITGDFTLTETSSSNVYTNVAVWDPTDGVFVEFILDNTLNDFISLASNFFTSDFIYKTDSFSKVTSNSGINNKTFVVYGFGFTLDDNNDVSGSIPVTGPFFIVNAVADNTLPTSVLKLSFILPKDIEGYDINGNFETYLSDLTPFNVQKIGDNDLSPDDQGDLNLGQARLNNEVMLYTGMGIFFLELERKKISDKSFQYSNDDPASTYVIPVESLNGESSNIYHWLNPAIANTTYFNKSFTKYCVLDDRYRKNIVGITARTQNDIRYLNIPKLIVASGWSKFGDLANLPAEYNNVNADWIGSPSPITMQINPTGTLKEALFANNDRLFFNEQNKLILVTLENQVELNRENGENNLEWFPHNSNVFYSFKEIEMPMSYGEIITNAYLSVKSEVG